MKTFYTSDRKKWRKWLENNFEKEEEIWFIFPTKDSTDKSLSYNDAVEESLCFEWIDSNNRTLDETHKARRFTPRRKGSTYSQPNIERLIWLNERNMIHPKFIDKILPIITKPFKFPKDIIDEIKRDKEAYKNYKKFSDSYKRIRIAYIDAARKRPDDFRKRLDNFINKTRKNKLIIGYGGIDKYYK